MGLKLRKSRRCIASTLAEIDVICVTYLGSYPSLGVHHGHDRPIPADLEPLIQSTIDRLLGETPVIELINFIGKSQTSWSVVTDDLMKKDSASE